MDSEIYIPTDRVPPELLQSLKELVHRIRLESNSTTLSSTTTSDGLSASCKKEGDECDDLRGSGSVVHVLDPCRAEPKKDSDVVSLFDPENDSDAAGVLHPKTDSEVVSVYDQRKDTGAPSSYDQRKDSDVVSLFDRRPSPSKDTQNSGARPETSQMKEGEMMFEYRSSPLKDFVIQNSGFFQLHPQSHASPARTAPSASSQSSQQYSANSYPSQPEVPDPYTVPSQKHHRMSPFQPGSGLDVEEERRLVSNRSPCKTPKRYEDTVRQLNSSFVHYSESPSVSEAPSSTITATMSSSSQSSRSRSPPSQCCSNDDDLHRGIPAGSVSPSGDVAQKSPKVLTPPETPESDPKRVVPEVFTFDDLTCNEERLNQAWERLRKLHDQFTPTKRSPSTPRHPPSTPTTPSGRRQEVLPSPTVRRLSPMGPQFLQRMEAAAAGSPQPKLKASEMPGSPAPPPLQSTPQRLSAEEYSPQRRDSLSPKPKKRLCFDEDGLSPQMLHPQRLRTYDTSAAPYPLASPRPSGSGSESPFPFPLYSMEGQHFGRGASGKPAPSFVELHKKMASLGALHEGREVDDDDDDDERGGPFFSGTRHVYESIEFQNRLAMQAGRYTPKRKRSELMDDGNDGMAMCTCAVMERNFLQMAECAYKRIRRMDATPAGFDRFRNELMQTNEILRESMGLMKHIRDLCDHRKRPRW